MGWPGIIAALMLHGGSLEPVGLKEVFPGVRIDAAKTVVEFDAVVSPALVRDARAPRFYLEVLICSPNSREHETFLVSSVKPSHIHAAMLLIGLLPGSPGGWTRVDDHVTPKPPTGDRLDVRFVYSSKSGGRVVADPLNWIINAEDGTPFTAHEAAKASSPGWVFAGSSIVQRQRPGDPAPAGAGPAVEMYDADGTGVIMGLTTFGSEVIAWSRVISPEAAVDAPTWIADFEKTPSAGTLVAVRVRKRMGSPAPVQEGQK